MPAAVQVIYDSLRPAGIEHDEGPDKGGDEGPMCRAGASRSIASTPSVSWRWAGPPLLLPGSRRTAGGREARRDAPARSLPHIVNAGGKKLGKRAGDASLQDLPARGNLRGAVVNYLALLGRNPGDEREVLTVGTVMWPLRIALSGSAATPGRATKIAAVLGREQTPDRIDWALARLS